jgi:EXLDI family protein
MTAVLEFRAAVVSAAVGIGIVLVMPTKTIYVSAADLVVLNRAAGIAGGLSAAVCVAVRQYVEHQEASMSGFEQIEVTVSDGQVKSRKRFIGRRLARVVVPGEDADQSSRFTVYLTRRDQFAVHVRTGRDWPVLRDEDGASWADPQTWSSDWPEGTRTLEVYADIEAMAEQVPAPVVEAVRRAMATPHVEELDI